MNSPGSRMPVVLVIAGSDSGGGAGIQADLKACAALGVWGATAITALTAQDTRGVHGVHAVPPAFVRAQVEAVAGDLEVAAVKVGMLANAAIVYEVAALLREGRFERVVVDPVMVAASGAPLLEEDAVAAVREELLPLATLATPNLPEAEVLLGRPLADEEGALVEAAGELSARCGAAVLLKAGHREHSADDILAQAGGSQLLRGERIPRGSAHGTGCALASAIAAHLARGYPLVDACTAAKAHVRAAIADGFAIGGGEGVLHQFWEYYGREGLPGPPAG